MLEHFTRQCCKRWRTDGGVPDVILPENLLDTLTGHLDFDDEDVEEEDAEVESSGREPSERVEGRRAKKQQQKGEPADIKKTSHTKQMTQGV